MTDTESTCPLWAKAGWCQTDSDLLDKCPHSCQKYGLQGGSSLDERYITVNFQEASSATQGPVVSEIVAPPAPSAAISPYSELNLVRFVCSNAYFIVLGKFKSVSTYVTRHFIRSNDKAVQFACLKKTWCIDYRCHFLLKFRWKRPKKSNGIPKKKVWQSHPRMWRGKGGGGKDKIRGCGC